MNITEAYELVNNHTFFVRPYYNKDNSKIDSFEVDFQDAIYIFPTETDDGNVKWICEFGCWYLESNAYSIWVEDIITGESYEDCIIQLAEWLVNRFGKDNYMDYFVLDENCNIETEKTDTGYMITKINNDSYWKEDELMEKLRGYIDEN